MRLRESGEGLEGDIDELVGKKDREWWIEAGETVRRDWESQGGDWKETLMSCWGRKIGSDDLKKEKLLEETERVRGGTGRRHWWVAGEERPEVMTWKEEKLLDETERVRGGTGRKHWWVAGQERLWDWESQGGDWKETLMSCWGRNTGSDNLKEEKLLDETESVGGGLEGDIDELLGKKDCETERVRGGGGDWKETLMSCWGRKTVRLRESGGGLEGDIDELLGKKDCETESQGGTGRRHWWVAGEERSEVMTWSRRNC